MKKAGYSSDVGILVSVDEYEQSDEDGRQSSLQEFLEQDRVLYKVKCLSHVHQAAEDIPTIPQEVAGSLNDSPGTHVGRDIRLIGELQFVDAKLGSKENDEDPIQQFEYKAADCNCSVVLAGVYISKYSQDSNSYKG